MKTFETTGGFHRNPSKPFENTKGFYKNPEKIQGFLQKS